MISEQERMDRILGAILGVTANAAALRPFGSSHASLSRRYRAAAANAREASNDHR